ncbi:ComF family protein [Ehrlichia ruminantium]|uniref:Similar to competence protein F (DNA transformation protein comF) n=1 Tax=Ehrlichia ruminantium (strain Welgevonden) TaxID=254945 RepID=A0A0H3M7I4_EHRRW|nr:ComF family protein [Ehrlichia ruminantium]QLK50172.1 ComF family protein [Ehrlichia ruminantium]QLK51097.1 ComF family protein [Ehrlichia ruminantium]QLK52929.1 ComF family protein [Ehrlichia ruminantium]QLK54767.1 ComF family protein [Ehrlichia ruminantium]QLK55687.1 ComF family protein [Ehrlichia ruminantium]
MFSKIINHIFPKTCAGCECIIPECCDLCSICSNNIDFLHGNYCISCGFKLSEGISICGKCIANKPMFTKLESIFSYDKYSKNIILNFKFFDNTLHIKTYAKWMYNKNPSLFNNVTTIIPVPIHKKRLRQRKYNQATLLARALSKYCNIPLEISVLVRIINTIPQYSLSSKMRKENIMQSFIIKNQHRIYNKTILLVDDVVTTGITVRTCSQKLIESGAKEIRVITLGRTL